MSIQQNPEEGLVIDVRPHHLDRAVVRGPLEIYHGTRTREKRAQHGYEIKGSGSGVRALKSLQTVLAWSRWDPNIAAIVDHCSETRGGGKLSELREALGGMVGGDSGHRFSGSLGDRDAYINGTATFSSHCKINTDNSVLSATQQDYPVMFQEFMLYMIAVAEYRARRVSPTTALAGRLTFLGHNLVPLSGETLTTTEPVTDLPTVETPRLLKAKDPKMIRSGGCWWGGSIALRPVEPEDVVFQSVIAEIRHSILLGRGGTAHLEGGLEIRSFRFGVLEVVNAGLDYVLDAMAIAIIEAGDELIHSKANRKRFNHSTSLLLQKYGRPLAKALVPYALHPLLKDDPLVIRARILESPTYFSGVSPVIGIASELMRRVRSFISEPSSPYFITPVVCFGSDRGAATVDAELRLLRREVSRAAVTGQISYDEANFLVGSTIKRMVPASQDDEGESLLSIATILCGYGTYKRGGIAVSDVGERICRAIAMGADGMQVLGLNVSSEEVVRELRKTVNGRKGRRPHMVPIKTIKDEPLRWRTKPGERPSLPRSVHQASDTYRRHVGHTGMLGSTSVFVWGSLRELMTGRHVVIIGSGLGGTALAASMGLAASISGLDLCSDFNVELNLRTYVPPLLARYGGHVRYRQCAETVVAGGIWEHPLVHRPILASLRSDSLLVLDIPMQDGHGFANLRPLVDSRTSAMCLIRLRGYDVSLAHALGYLRHHFRIHGHYRFDPAPGSVDVVFLATVGPTREYRSDRVAYLGAAREAQSPVDTTDVGFYLSVLCDPLGGPSGTTVRECLRAFVRGAVEARGTGVLRPSYTSWSDILVSFVAAELLLLYSGDALWYKCMMTLGEERFVSEITPGLQVICSSRLRWVLTRLVPGLSTHLDEEY